MKSISEELALQLIGKECYKDNYFNPVQDDKKKWFLSDEEYELVTNTDYKTEIKAAKDEVYVKVDKVEEYKLKEEADKLKEVK